MIPRPLELFYSYSHKDEELRDQLEEHLSMLKREGVIKGWHDRRISGGREWEGQIDQHLTAADIILLLTSSAFLASDYCYDTEVKRAMERHEQGEARVIPIILRACDWHTAPFGKLQAFPKDGKPVKQWPDQDVAFLDIANGIRRVAEEMKTTKKVEEEAEPESPKPDPYLLIPNLRVSFVPRQDTTGNDIVKLLQAELSPQRPRLVALWGAGGVGKTAIAAEAVRDLIEPFTKRLAWVSADGLDTFSLATLLDEVATQLGHADLRKLSPHLKKEQVRDLVRSAATLVVLDNFETIEEAERIRCVDWLGKPAPCSGLITTRDAIEGARNIPIEAMRTEEAKALLDQLIGQAHDPRAFAKLDRDRLIQTAEANPLVLQWIVGQIDLAQDPEEVLDDLRHGEGSAAERVFKRSYELRQLENGGRAVLLALSLFAPSGTRKAVAEVSGLAKESDRRKFRDAIRSLSALWLIQTADDTHRLTVEGLTRELTRARFHVDPRGKAFGPRFVERFVRYAKSYAKPLRENYDALELEKDNLLAACERAFQDGRADALDHLAELIAGEQDAMLRVRGYWEEAINIGELALTCARSLSDERMIAAWANNLAYLYEHRGDFARAELLAKENLAISEKLGKQNGVGNALHLMARIAHAKGELIQARRLYEQSMNLSKDSGEMKNVAVSLHHLGWLAQEEGQFEEAERFYKESLGLRKHHDNLQIVGATYHHLGWLACEKGDLPDARRLYEDSLKISKELGDSFGIATISHQLGELSLIEGKTDEAERFLLQSHTILRNLGDTVNCAECLESIGKLRFQQGRLDDARAAFNEAFELAERLRIPLRVASVKHSLALLSEKQGNYASAVRLIQEALSIFDTLHSPKAADARSDLERLEAKSS